MNLNKIIDELYTKLDIKDKQINELMLENGKLKKEKENLIKYLENEINEIKGTGLDNGSYDEYLSGRLDSNEAILEKVKSGNYE